MTPCDPATGGADARVAAYEQLRHEVLAGAAQGTHCRPFGLVLLLRAGISAWMDHRSAGSAPAGPWAAAEQPVAAPLASVELHAGLVRVLASIALAHREEMRL